MLKTWLLLRQQYCVVLSAHCGRILAATHTESGPSQMADHMITMNQSESSPVKEINCLFLNAEH